MGLGAGALSTVTPEGVLGPTPSRSRREGGPPGAGGATTTWVDVRTIGLGGAGGLGAGALTIFGPGVGGPPKGELVAGALTIVGPGVGRPTRGGLGGGPLTAGTFAVIVALP